MDLDLEGKIALVTGGRRGIGLAIVNRLAREGCDVLVVARDASGTQTAAQEVARSSGRRVIGCAADLSRPNGIEKAREALSSTFGRLDILVNNAGFSRPGDLLELTDSDWQARFAIKLYAAVRLSQALWPMLIESHGAVINVIGGFARNPSPRYIIDGAVGAALMNFTKALATRGLIDDVNVNAVHPGKTMTDLWQGIIDRQAAAEGRTPEDVKRSYIAASSIRRFGEPDDTAAAVAFLASPISRHVRGTDFIVDGGAAKSL